MGMLLMMLAGWSNRHQQDVIVYLEEENKILPEELVAKRFLPYTTARHGRQNTSSELRDAGAFVPTG